MSANLFFKCQSAFPTVSMKRNLTKFSFDDHDLWILSRNQISIIRLLQAGTRKYISEFDDVAIRSEKKSKIFF
jgi:hypothetical protein